MDDRIDTHDTQIVKRRCASCPTEFTPSRYALARGEGRFCSRACVYVGRKPRRIADANARFWASVNKQGPTVREGIGECWEWTGATFGFGYGMFSVRKKRQVAHRASWELANGPVPPGILVCHRCDNPACVRPDHLFLGTYADNHTDMESKGRGKLPPNHRGSANGNASMTEESVAELRRRYAAGERQVDLAARYGISQPVVSQIVRRVTWKHVT